MPDRSYFGAVRRFAGTVCAVLVTQTPIYQTSDGRTVHRYDITAPNGSGMAMLDYGATIIEVRTADRDGRLANVALGYQDIGNYETNGAYLGALVGRVAGRTAGGSFEIEGQRVHLPSNEGRVHLHGGPIGFHRRMYEVDVMEDGGDAVTLVFHRTSPVGEDGYPSTADVRVEVSWSISQTLRLKVSAKADGVTPISMAHHGWWNLAGVGSGTIADHVLTVHADAFLPMRGHLVTDGSIAHVQGSLLDLRGPVQLAGLLQGGGRLNSSFPAADVRPSVREQGGLDHAFVVVPAAPTIRREVAVLSDPTSGRTMRLLTTEPVLHVNTGQGLNGPALSRAGKTFEPYDGVALVAQRYPNALHHAELPSPLLRPGDSYRMETAFAFSAS